MDEILCCVCDANLANCKTIWAAEGALYCSRSCGIHDFEFMYHDEAEEIFDDVSEEIRPDEAGIKGENRHG